MLYETAQQFSQAVRNELENNLVPFWLERSVDPEYGGFIGQMSNDGTIDPRAPKGLILNARVLWTFSALYRFNEDNQYLDMARRAYDYLETYFWDSQHGGAFWQVDFQGRPLDDKKKIYGQAFYIYALAEYYQAFGSDPAIQLARQLYDLIETNSRDQLYGGYIEVCNRDWSVAEDLRLSEKDMDEKKSMNNHLHLLEAYTNLYRIWPDTQLRERLTELFDIFDWRITDQASGHLNHFFDDTWQPKSANYTFGHDIEASWLLCEAAEVLDDSNITSRAQRLALRLARVTLAEALDNDGGLCYEGQAGKVTDPNREWWPQAESVVGFLNAYELSSDRSFLEAALKAWDFIEKYFVERKYGEWFWRIDRTGCPDPTEPKISQWKGPYHNVRTCLETIRRLQQIIPGGSELI
ncbi:MAG: N-acyl-D-glucosamine 2-epimerase [Planctomycetes bacterium RBG_19FT_COMBO_48_8]|nr:MAG: N-acyl-D-glucosamine 2-epimerase [Planctomycetes bacterium RBG_19FT_COMBO_48_8]